MNRWSPLTKLLLLVAVLAIPYLLWTGSEDTPPVAQSRRAETTGGAAGAPSAAGTASDAAAADPAADGSAPGAIQRRSPAPLQTFAAIVERPLFTPTRRLVRPVEAPPLEPEPEAESELAAESEPAAARPDLRFFGTLSRGGEVTALVTRDGETALAKLAVGDAIDDWQVREVTRDRLVLAQAGEEVVYTIFTNAAPDGSDAGSESIENEAGALESDPADEGGTGGEDEGG